MYSFECSRFENMSLWVDVISFGLSQVLRVNGGDINDMMVNKMKINSAYD